MAVAQAQMQQSFADRLSRIENRQGNVTGTVHIGLAEEDNLREQKAVNKAIARQKKRRANGSFTLTLLILPFAFAFGALAVFSGRLIAFHLFRDGGPYAFDLGPLPASMFMDFTIAALLAAVFAGLFRFSRGIRRVALLAGVLAMMGGETFLVEQYPDMAAMLFAEDYFGQFVLALNTEL